MFAFRPSETCYHSTLDLFKIHHLDQAPYGYWDGKHVVEATKMRGKAKPPCGRAKSTFVSAIATQPTRSIEDRRLENDLKRMDIDWCAKYGEVAKSQREQLKRVDDMLGGAAGLHNRILEVVGRESEQEIKLKLELLESLLQGIDEIVAHPVK